MKFRKGDQVIITAGKDKGKKGKIEKVYPRLNQVLLPGLNLFKKHLKKRDEQNPGGVIQFPRPIPISAIALVCPKCGKKSRVGYQIRGDKKLRICKKCQSII